MRVALIVLVLCLTSAFVLEIQATQAGEETSPNEGDLDVGQEWDDHISAPAIVQEEEGEMPSDSPDHSLLLDPLHYQVNIHFTTVPDALTVQPDPLELSYNSVPFQCTTTRSDKPLTSVFANPTPTESTFPSYHDRHSPLSSSQMLGLSHHFRVLKQRCYFDMASTLGKDYLYQTCFFPGSLKRGDVLIVERDSNTGVTQMTWENVVSLANATDIDSDWWGFVENDPVALDRTGYSSYFYQYYGENVIVQYHCAQRVKYLGVDEPSRGQFVVVYGTPLACTHPFIQRVRSHSHAVECYLDSDSPHEMNTEIEGPWKIFDSGDQLYHGSVEISKFEYFEWPDPTQAFPEREPFALDDPHMYHLQWALSGGESYRGIGIAIDQNICVGWSPHDLAQGPGVSVFRKSSPRLMDGYWWSPTGYGLEELTRLPKPKSKSDQFSGSYALLRTVDSEGESITYYGTVTIEYQTNLDSYVLLWATKGLGSFLGHGVVNGDQMCVIWRKRRKTNDGVVNYLIEGDRAHGRWGLSVGSQRTQTEDLIRANSL